MLTIHRLLPDGQLAPSGGVLWPSLPNPQVNVEQLAIENPRETSNDEGYLLCDLIISGSITSRLCNTIPGSDSTIEEVFFDVNDSEARQRFAIQVDKREDTAVASPFPFRGTFRFKIDDVPITEGNNIFTVSARDKVYGIDGHRSPRLRTHGHVETGLAQRTKHANRLEACRDAAATKKMTT